MKHRPVIPPPPDAAPPILARDAPWLAPMAGYSDAPFRLLCREMGAAVCVTEMVSAKGLLHDSPGTGDLLRSPAGDAPLVIQLFGGEDDVLGRATALLHDAGYAWFDCNMGCSVRKVRKQGAGAALLGEPERAMAVARAMIAAAGRGHVGFKLRLGLDDEHHVWMDLALRLQDAGAGWIALHPRTAHQGFSGTADWEAIAALAGRLDIPVLASGDLFTARDGAACLEATGAAGVMFARGALGNPAIFTDHMDIMAGREPEAPSMERLRRVLLRHLELVRMCAGDDGDRAATWRARFIAPRYARHLPGIRRLRTALCGCASWEDVVEVIAEFFDGPHGADAPQEGRSGTDSPTDREGSES